MLRCRINHLVHKAHFLGCKESLTLENDSEMELEHSFF